MNKSIESHLNLSKIENKYERSVSAIKGTLAEHNIAYLNGDLKKIKALKDIHQGKTAFLIGNGPSVQTKDLEQLKDGIGFCCNRFYLAYDLTTFRPNYTLASDKQTITDFGQEMVFRAGGTVVISYIVKPPFDGEFIWLPQQYTGLFDSIYKGAVPGGGTLIVAIQLALHMGIKDFVLYGVDHNYPNMNKTESKDIYYSASGEGNHFIKNYRSEKPWCPPNVEAIETSFNACKDHIIKLGGSIVNATRGGKLEIFERRPIEEYFK